MLAPPSWTQRSRELLLGRDLARLAIGAPGLRSLPRGDGRPVLVITGFGGTDPSLLPLRRFLGRLGHDVRPAGLGRISDEVEDLYPRVGNRCAAIATETGRQVALVGWSIGGVLAREAARDHPDAVSRVVTFGAPIEGGPAYTALAGRYDAERLAEIAALIDERHRTPIRLPVTAIWSPNDGIVTPEACLDHRTPDAENVRVSSTHIGMGLDPDVWSAIARRLAQPTNEGVTGEHR